MRDIIQRSRLFKRSLKKRTLEPPRVLPGEPWKGDQDLGVALLGDALPFGGKLIELGDDPWKAEMDDRALEALHGFRWLNDLCSIKSDIARAKARTLAGGWIARHKRRAGLPWRADVVGERLSACLAHYREMMMDRDEGFEAAFLRAIHDMAARLADDADGGPPDERGFLAVKGLMYAALSVPGMDDALEPALHRLVAEIDRQILSDGGHASRNPAATARVLRYLVDVRALMRDADHETPGALQDAIERMAPLVMGLRLGDGGLVQFNGADEGDRDSLDDLLAHCDVKNRPLAEAPRSGFQRLSAGHTVLVADVGGPPSPGLDLDAHAGALSFELSIGGQRVFVNVGRRAGATAAWTAAARATAAHTTMTVNDTNSSEINADGGIGRRPSSVRCARGSENGGALIEAEHDGYMAPFGLLHKRSLFMSSKGHEIRGEDFVEGPGTGEFAVRFYLHPDVKASLLVGGGGVLLRLPRGKGWQFLATGGDIALEEAVYLGGSRMRRTEQIVVTGPVERGGAVVQWRMAKVS